jgi:pimeloyl-ACP methyl ester carboxylesterase
MPSNGSSSTDRAGASPAHAQARPTIVFLHGTRLTGAQWAVQIAALSDDYHCLAPDLLGHGSAAGETFTVEAAAERVAGLIEREGRDGRAILVGLSLGAYLAMAVAARWPERVTGLAISGATAEPVSLRSIAYRGLATIFSTVPDAALDAVNRRFFAWRYRPEIHEPIIAGGFYFAGGAVAVRSLVGERFKPRLAAYPGPTLILNGEYDLFFRPSERSFAAAAVHPKRVLIRGATHHANLDRPEAFTAAIRRFAESIPG